MTDEKKIARPTKYTPEVARLICDRISSHDIGTARLCEMYHDLPCKTYVYEWIAKYPEFEEMYKKAKNYQAFLMADSLDDIAFERRTYFDGEGNEKLDPAWVNDKRLRIDTRKWIAAKLLPKVYGDNKNPDNNTNPQETLSKIASLVAELNKTNDSEI